MDFGFIQASTSDYTLATSANSTTDRVVEPYDGFVAYLIIVDECSKFIWRFLCKSKETPINLVSHFLQMYGRTSGGVIRCYQGGKLARSHAFRSTMLKKHLYIVKPTGADSPSQNGGTKNGMIHWQLQLMHYYMVLLFLLSIGLPPSPTLPTSTIDKYIVAS
jgi:hypothetical protein